jgi:HEAT repeat protein
MAARQLLASAMRPFLTFAAVVLIMSTMSGSRAGTAGPPAPDAESGDPQVVHSVETSGDEDRLEVRLNTGDEKTPWFSVFPLRDPDRLVFDLPNYLWEPGLTAHLESAHPDVQEIRVGQFSEDPPVTRLVLDLSIPVAELRYRTTAPGDSLGLRVRVADEPKAHTILEEKNRRPAVAALPPVEPSAPEPGASETAAAPVTETPPPVAPPTPASVSTPAAIEGPPAPAATVDPDPTPVAPQVEQPRPTRPELAASAPSPAPAQAATSGASWRSQLPRFLGAIAVLTALGFLAFWLRKRFQSTSEEAAVFAEQASPGSRPEGVPGKEASLDLVRCRIVDGYLVLAPEGGRAAIGNLSQAPQRARIEGHVEVVAAESATASAGQATPEMEGAAELSAPPTPTSAAGAAGSPGETAEQLVAALSDEDVTVRKTAAQGLWTLADGGRADVLVPYLQNEDPRVRLVIAGVLGEAGATQCADDLAALLTDGDASVRASTVYAFSQLGAAVSPHSEAVEALLSDPEELVRARAVEAFAAMNPQSGEAARRVLELVEDTDASVREAAVDVSLAYADRGVTQPMTEFMGDVSQRAQALELLQRAEDATLRRLLIAARMAGEEGNRGPLDTISYAVRARWTPESLGEDLQSTEEEARLAALESLAIIGGEDAMAQIATIAQTDPSTALKNRAAEILDASQEVVTQTTG